MASGGIVVFLLYRLILNLLFTGHIVFFGFFGLVCACFGVVWMLSDSVDQIIGHTKVVGVHVGLVLIIFGIYTILVNIPQLIGVIISKSIILVSDILQTFVGMAFMSLATVWIFGIFFDNYYVDLCSFVHESVGNTTFLGNPITDDYLIEFCAKFSDAWHIPYILIPVALVLFIGVCFQSCVSHQIVTARGYKKHRKKKMRKRETVTKVNFVPPPLPTFEQTTRFDGGINFSHKDIDGDDNVTDYFIADSALEAMNWLNRHEAIDTKKYRVIVQTPNGNWGLNYLGGFCDHPGSYHVAQLPISGYNDGEECKVARVSYPFKASMKMVKNGTGDFYVAKICCGLCETTFWAEIDPSGEDTVQCLSCAAKNNIMKDFSRLDEIINGPSDNPIAVVAKKAREFLDSNEDVRDRLLKAADVLEQIDNDMVNSLISDMQKIARSTALTEMELMNYCGNFQVQIEDMIEAIYRSSQ